MRIFAQGQGNKGDYAKTYLQVHRTGRQMIPQIGAGIAQQDHYNQ